jgi:hypothetical protein
MGRASPQDESPELSEINRLAYVNYREVTALHWFSGRRSA